MLTQIWESLLYQPLLNGLAVLVSFVPWGDVGIAVVILTIIVRLILFPLSKKQIKSQNALNRLSPEINKIKQSNKTKEEQAKETFELYKKNKVNPFSGCLIVLIQIPIIFTLYYVFLHFKETNFTEGLYNFISKPENINTMFLGLIDIAQKSWILAILAGITQFFQAHFMPQPIESNSPTPNFSDSFAKSMRVQMKYVFPFIVVFISYSISGAIALYWTTSNLFATLQQIHFNKKIKESVDK